MNTVDELRSERKSPKVPFTIFLGDYKKTEHNICYGFVEGKDDPSYYRQIINTKLPESCKIILYPCDGKKIVSYIHKKIDWRKFSKKRIIFFIDKDLSDFIEDENIIFDDNVYITDKYSIENSIVCKDTLESVMRDLLGFSSISRTEMDIVLKIFKEQKRKIEEFMTPLMANIILWKRHHTSPANYRNFRIKKIMQIEKGEIFFKKKSIQLIKYFYKTCNVDFSKYNRDIVNGVIKEIKDKKLTYSIIRGKYIADFFICFCNSIEKDHEKIGIKKTHSGRQLFDNDFMQTIAPRCRPPKTLHIFLNNTIIHHLKTKGFTVE